MLSENGDVIKTTQPWVSKMADKHYHAASISRQFRGPIHWNAHVSSSFDHAHWGYNSVFKQIRRCSVDGLKRYENDKCGRKSFWKRNKTAPFSFENGLVWTGSKKHTKIYNARAKHLKPLVWWRSLCHLPSVDQLNELMSKFMYVGEFCRGGGEVEFENLYLLIIRVVIVRIKTVWNDITQAFSL